MIIVLLSAGAVIYYSRLWPPRKTEPEKPQSSDLSHLDATSSKEIDLTVLAELDAAHPYGYLSPEEAAALAEKLRPVVHAELRDAVTWDERTYHTYCAAASRAAEVDGKHVTEWIPRLDQMRSAKLDDAALTLLSKCLDAAERWARAEGMAPPRAYTERTAIIYRRRRDYAAEVRVLERWMAAADLYDERADDHSDSAIAIRLAKAQSLMGD